ncbi:N-acetylmuramoyl-L-alanine amidase [Paenibacillus selenitireducens]|uniref:N-acetylmuramoyl-L-alanine amidase n=1 Tax=Paenibacillus selenitireducens TaxID=1324314 RepID=A0A1T2WZW1_9BACL|nr:N-acetylmuramoyl-L-alanine amidase [Paenibacillus selenitireducens]OPA73006.1 N-acetylmuramoyl-L-alanine amidase [Paenibacillus selenitireducens]
MKRIRRKQLQRRQTIFMISIVVFMGMVWSIYAVSSTISGNQITTSAESTVSPNKNMATPNKRYKIVIDAGHGGKDPGAEGVSGNHERSYTLALSTKVYELLQQEPMFEPHSTRTDDTFVNLEDRAHIANDLDADAFVSIHGNTFSDPDVSGTETYYYTDESLLFASKVHEQLAEATGFKDRGVKKEGWEVLKLSNNLAILLEIGFLTNPSDETNMLSEMHQNQTAEAIVSGIKKYFLDREG